MFLIDGASSDPMFEEMNEEDNGVNDKADMNIRDINVPADRTINENTTNVEGNTSQSCHQKLEAKRNMTKQLVGTIITKKLKNRK